MSVQIYKDGKLTPVAGELYESGNVVPLANHANTANTANKADSANRALTDGRGYEISRTYMPRGIDFKAGPFYSKDLGDVGTVTRWTATEDCFVTILMSGGDRQYGGWELKIDGVSLFGYTCSDGGHGFVIFTGPIAKGQEIYIKAGYRAGRPALTAYRYIY